MSQNTPKKQSKKNYFKGIIFFALFFCFSSNTNASGAVEPGSGAIDTSDSKGLLATLQQTGKEIANWATSFEWEEFKEAMKTAGSKAYHSALSSALNQIAYDTATWIGSGGDGQEPMFITEGWGEYLTNIGDNAAGAFIEELGKNGYKKFNLCEPDLELQVKIGLGLVNYKQPSTPACTFSKMLDNWEEELESGDFLNNFQDMFEPTSNDFGIALTLQTGIMEAEKIDKQEATHDREETEGWLDLRGIDGLRDNYPKFPEDQVELANYLRWSSFGEITTDPFIDAANIFLNRLALVAFQNAMSKIGDGADSYTSAYDWDSLTNYYASPNNSGIAGAEEQFRNLLEPNFSVRGDYEILAELTMCSDPTNAGPTNCVIEEQFRQAIENNMTVGDAMDQGYLNEDGLFAFNSDGLEPNYVDLDYPYRSMLILRKFRIIPVGWELAGQYIKDNPDKGSMSLGDLVACFEADDAYSGYNEDWCEGLVDPNWVLKAPLNYCKREGYGPEILVEQITGEDEDSEYVISRNDNYCADEQSCILENSDGSCEKYGYCTEEKRKWNFGSDSCDAKYNTCQTFRSSEGDTISYLKNTLDYGICNVDNVGCQAYSMLAFDYATTTDAITWSEDETDLIYFDDDVEECDEDDEGCHGFIRTKKGLGVNLLPNSSFEDDLSAGGWDSFGTQTEESIYGSYSLEMTSNINKTVSIDATDYEIGGEIITLSFYAKDCSGSFYIEEQSNSTDLENSSDWQLFETSYIYPEDDTGDSIEFVISSSSCLIDAIKLERGEEATAYSDYGNGGTVYEKLLPDYLEDSCYVSTSDYQYKDDAPDKCYDYARKCNEDEVDCAMYTSQTDGFSIPAKVNVQDYCTAECVGYDEYMQAETAFDSNRVAYFIPKIAQSCSSAAVGCDEFTNLDEAENGGEAIEYYSYLRQCTIPSESTCADFYTWEGSDEEGYQLKNFRLKKDDDSDDVAGDYSNDPAVTEDDSSKCNEDIYNLVETDPSYNSDCREFYNQSGEISYHLYSKTITCSDDCHPYRRTENNIDSSITDNDNCNANGSSYSDVVDEQFSWDDTINNGSGGCYFCKNGGTWNDEHGACIYMAIPDEGTSCTASQEGCRKYTGDIGNNMQIVLNDDFEDGDTDDWSGNSLNLNNPSNESLIMGGHSLVVYSNDMYDGKISKNVSDLVNEGNSYVLQFLVKGVVEYTELTLKFISSNESQEFNKISINKEWNVYELNLSSLDIKAESISITGSNHFFIDDIRLTEIIDNYYLIKDSWSTPDSCYDDMEGVYQGETYNLGCDEYENQEGDTHYLHSFSQLCQESAIGCELMIDTHNYDGYSSYTSATSPAVSVPANNYTYVVYDEDKDCDSGEKGCQRLGNSYKYDTEIIYSDIYLLNNPDDYAEILCDSAAVGCEEWETDSGTSYFIDPEDMVCEWRQEQNSVSNTYGWYKEQVYRCDGDADGEVSDSDNICLSDSNCETTCSDDNDCTNTSCVDGVCSYSCILDNNDYECDTDSGEVDGEYIAPKTVGSGGVGNEVAQPTNGWVGLCPASESGCTEYIDPVSQFSENMLFNSDFSLDVDGNGPDGWTYNGTYYMQDVYLEQGYLYKLSGPNDSVIGIKGEKVYEKILLFVDNKLIDSDDLPVDKDDKPIINVEQGEETFFYTLQEDVYYVFTNSIDNPVNLKKVIVDYQIATDLDKTSCNGIYDFDKGCILFNEREVNADGYEDLIYNAKNTEDGATPDTSSNYFDSNSLIKVSPDRVCNEWLACKSFIKDEYGNNVCYDVGLCNSFDDNGYCDGFVSEDQVNQTYTMGAEGFENKTGYSKVGYENSSLLSDYYSLGAMEQVGEVAQVSNGNFESYGSNYYPLGWSISNVIWSADKFQVIDNPVEAEYEGIDYPIEGESFLKFSLQHGEIESEFIEVEPDTEYRLSADINTLNFQAGSGFDVIQAALWIYTYDEDGDPVGSQQQGGTVDVSECRDIIKPWNNGCSVNSSANQDWHNMSLKFKLGSNTRKIKIFISGGVWWRDNPDSEVFTHSAMCYDFNTVTEDTCAGTVYLDDIKITPVLNNKEDSTIAKSCRLYPEDDSLSCEYYEDSGIKKKGLWGYCLEYDRYPGNEDACLLWYPIDKVKGDGIEEGAGYQGKVPVYYTTDIAYEEINILYENRASGQFYGGLADGCGNPSEGTVQATNENYILERIDLHYHGDHDRSGEGIIIYAGETKAEAESESTDNIIFEKLGVDYEETIITIPFTDQKFGLKYFHILDKCNEPGSGATEDFDIVGMDFYYTVPYADTVVQTVTSIGQNKYWSGRVYEGSNYKISCNEGIPGVDTDCFYSSDQSPFGSVVPPGEDWSIIANPYEWDGEEDAGNQPLYYEIFEDEGYNDDYARMGQLISKDYVKRLFAESYGFWKWNGSNYTPISGKDWSPPETICVYDSRYPSQEEIEVSDSDHYTNNSCQTAGCISGYSNCYDFCMEEYGRPGECACAGIDCIDNCCDCNAFDWCAYPPEISNIKVDDVVDSDVEISKTAYVNLTFNSNLDNQQLPLVMYAVDWGDGEETKVSGVEMLHRPDADNPHSLYHLYSYWDLKAKAAKGIGQITCSSGKCSVTPSVKIRDNWGWCNNGVNNDICPADGYQSFGGTIIVSED